MMGKLYLIFLLVLILSVTIVSSQLNYNNPNLPKITSSTPETTITSINNNTVNVNSSNCWQGDCGGFRRQANQDTNTTSNVRFNQLNITDTLNFDNNFPTRGNIKLDSEFLMRYEGFYGHNFVSNTVGSILFMNGTTGRIGIGTNHPSNLLDVRGSINASGPIYFNNGTVVTGINGGTAGYISQFQSGSTLNNSVIYQASGGKVGIGTTTPVDVFQIATAGGNVYVNSTEGSIQAMNIKTETVGNLSTRLGYVAGTGQIEETSLGWFAGGLQRGGYGTFLGSQTGYLNNGSYVTLLGRGAGYINGASYVTAVGFNSAFQNTGELIATIGYEAGAFNNATGLIAVGYAAGRYNTGIYTTALGYAAGNGNNGSNSVFIGTNAGQYNIVDNQFIVQQGNINAVPLIQGNFATGNVGIGTATPSNKLDVQGGINVSGAVNTNALYIDGVIRMFDFNGYTAVNPKNNLFLMLGGAQYGTYNTGNNRSIYVYTTDGEAIISSPNVGAGFTPIKIVTNGTVQMTFSIDNKVGIGTEFPTRKLDVRGDINVSGPIFSGNITSPHQTYNYNGSVVLNTQYNNTLDRPILVSVTGVATVALLNDIAYFTMKNGGSIPDEAQAYGCIKQITGSVGVSVYCQLTMTVPPGYVWTVNSTTGGSGTTAIEIAKVTVI